MVEIDQFTGHKIEGHGIDAEIATRKVGLERARSHNRIFSRGGVMLLSRRGQIQRDPIQP